MPPSTVVRTTAALHRVQLQRNPTPPRLIDKRGRRAFSWLLAVFITAQVSSAGARARPADASAPAAPGVMSDPELNAGFRLLYELKFDQAREGFAKWQKERPEEPLGPALEA